MGENSSAETGGAEEAVRDWWYSERRQTMTSKEAAQSLVWYLAKCGLKVIRGEPQAPPWQPIETAPKDGTAIFATGGGLSDIVDIVSYNERVGAWNATHFTLDDRDNEPDGYSRPTHWMPIPDLPSSVSRPKSA